MLRLLLPVLNGALKDEPRRGGLHEGEGVEAAVAVGGGVRGFDGVEEVVGIGKVLAIRFASDVESRSTLRSQRGDEGSRESGGKGAQSLPVRPHRKQPRMPPDQSSLPAASCLLPTSSSTLNSRPNVLINPLPNHPSNLLQSLILQNPFHLSQQRRIGVLDGGTQRWKGGEEESEGEEVR
jgi:hypothetical protein